MVVIRLISRNFDRALEFSTTIFNIGRDLAETFLKIAACLAQIIRGLKNYAGCTDLQVALQCGRN